MISFKYENNGLNDTQLNELNEFLNSTLQEWRCGQNLGPTKS